MMTFNNINNSSASRILNTFKKDKAAEKVVDEMKSNKNVDLDFVEDKEKDDKLTTLKLIQADRPKDTKIEVVVNVDDIKRQAKENGVKEDVFLSQQIASVMSASYLMLDAIKDGKDPSKYLTNGEFLVASNLLADGMVRRTNKDAIPYLDQERANMAKRIEEEHGDVETAGSDAFERAEALGFKGINTGGWADKIVNGFGTTKDLDELDEVSEVDDDDEIDEVDDYDDDDYEVDDTDDADEVDDTDDEDTKAEEAKKDNSLIPGIPNWLLAGGAGLLASKFLFNDSGKDKKDAEKKTQLALAQQQQQFQLILAQQQAQQKAVLLQQQTQADYQAKLAAYQAQVAAANTASTTYPAYTTTASTPVVYSTTSSTTPTSYIVPTVAASDWG